MISAGDDNPLLSSDSLPQFSRIESAHVQPALDAVLAEARARLAELTARQEDHDWSTLPAIVEALEERVNRCWAPVGHLHAVADEAALREAYNEGLAKLTDYATEVGQNAALHQAYRTLAASAEYTRLDAPRRRVVDNALREFRLSGVDLPGAEKQRFAEISARLAQLSARFEENLLDATQAWTRRLDPAETAGIPVSALTVAAETARRRGTDGWVFGLDFPSYYAVITYAEDMALRREFYTAYQTRASDQGPHAGQWDNGPVMDELLELRHQQARVLGYPNYAELSLQRRMARTPGEVLELLGELARRARPLALAELEELRQFAREHYGIERIEAWDLAYLSERLRVSKFSLSQEDLRPYFPLPRVIQGLFDIVRRVFGVSAEEQQGADVWHPDVRLFALRDESGALLGRFYLDLYARAHKRGGAWMEECAVRCRDGDEVQLPVAFLTCNFTPPAGGEPALLTHDEVTTLFHEFGHGLHHLLTRIDQPSVAGINGVAWDAVELPSQLLENWGWEREALALFAFHHRTGEPLPESLFASLRASRNFHAGLQMLRQVEFALFDFRLHLDHDPHAGARVAATLDAVRREIAVFFPPDFTRFAHGFSHVFGGGYAAGYYSYKWAEVLAADAFSLFEECGIFDSRTGRSFRHTVLECGGSRDALDLFVEFRGREPRVDALLRQSGIVTPSSVTVDAR